MVYIIAHSVEEEEIISFVCVCKKYIYMMEREAGRFEPRVKERDTEVSYRTQLKQTA